MPKYGKKLTFRSIQTLQIMQKQPFPISISDFFNFNYEILELIKSEYFQNLFIVESRISRERFLVHIIDKTMITNDVALSFDRYNYFRDYRDEVFVSPTHLFEDHINYYIFSPIPRGFTPLSSVTKDFQDIKEIVKLFTQIISMSKKVFDDKAYIGAIELSTTFINDSNQVKILGFDPYVSGRAFLNSRYKSQLIEHPEIMSYLDIITAIALLENLRPKILNFTVFINSLALSLGAMGKETMVDEIVNHLLENEKSDIFTIILNSIQSFAVSEIASKQSFLRELSKNVNKRVSQLALADKANTVYWLEKNTIKRCEFLNHKLVDHDYFSSEDIIKFSVDEDENIFWVLHKGGILRIYSIDGKNLLHEVTVSRNTRFIKLQRKKNIICFQSNGYIQKIRLEDYKSVRIRLFHFSIVSDIAMVNDFVFIAFEDGYLCRYNIESEKLTIIQTTLHSISKIQVSYETNEVYVGDVEGSVFCLRFNDLSLKWEIKTSARFLLNFVVDVKKELLYIYFAAASKLYSTRYLFEIINSKIRESNKFIWGIMRDEYFSIIVESYYASNSQTIVNNQYFEEIIFCFPKKSEFVTFDIKKNLQVYNEKKNLYSYYRDTNQFLGVGFYKYDFINRNVGKLSSHFSDHIDWMETFFKRLTPSLTSNEEQYTSFDNLEIVQIVKAGPKSNKLDIIISQDDDIPPNLPFERIHCKNEDYIIFESTSSKGIILVLYDMKKKKALKSIDRPQHPQISSTGTQGGWMFSLCDLGIHIDVWTYNYRSERVLEKYTFYSFIITQLELKEIVTIDVYNNDMFRGIRKYQRHDFMIIEIDDFYLIDIKKRKTHRFTINDGVIPIDFEYDSLKEVLTIYTNTKQTIENLQLC